jgi:hypothetical protein
MIVDDDCDEQDFVLPTIAGGDRALMTNVALMVM